MADMFKKATNILKSNASIIDDLTSGYKVIGDMFSGTSASDAFKKAYKPTARHKFNEMGKKNINNLKKNKNLKNLTRSQGPELKAIGMKNAIRSDESWNYAKMAGGYMGLAAGARVVSGGGISRDRNGNPNIIGVPFV